MMATTGSERLMPRKSAVLIGALARATVKPEFSENYMTREKKIVGYNLLFSMRGSATGGFVLGRFPDEVSAMIAAACVEKALRLAGDHVIMPPNEVVE